MPIRLEPITDQIGVNVYGIDITKPLSLELISYIKDKLDQHLVLAFRQQPEMTNQQHLRFSELFGEHQCLPHAMVVKDEPNLGLVLTRSNDTKSNVIGLSYHSDSSFLKEPPFGAVMRPIILPSVGGDTEFVNMYAVYDSINPELQKKLATLHAVHRGAMAISKAKDEFGYRPNIDKVAVPHATHPVIRSHPMTGKKALYVNSIYTRGFVNKTVEESEPWLTYLFALTDKSKASCRIKWTSDTIVIWDNRFTQHRAIFDYQGQHRQLVRTTIQGDRPV